VPVRPLLLSPRRRGVAEGLPAIWRRRWGRG